MQVVGPGLNSKVRMQQKGSAADPAKLFSRHQLKLKLLKTLESLESLDTLTLFHLIPPPSPDLSLPPSLLRCFQSTEPPSPSPPFLAKLRSPQPRSSVCDEHSQTLWAAAQTRNKAQLAHSGRVLPLLRRFPVTRLRRRPTKPNSSRDSKDTALKMKTIPIQVILLILYHVPMLFIKMKETYLVLNWLKRPHEHVNSSSSAVDHVSHSNEKTTQKCRKIVYFGNIG